MLYAPSHFWSCHFPAIAFVFTVGSYSLFGMAALLMIVPFFLFSPLIIYVFFRQSAVSVLVDEGKMFVRQGFASETEYSLHDVESFTLIRNKFYTLKQLNILEWFFPKLKMPAQLIMQMTDGTQAQLFSYQYGSPFKRNWSNFATQLGLQTVNLYLL